jgi:hypothetical protein
VFAILNQTDADLKIPTESRSMRFGIRHLVLRPASAYRAAGGAFGGDRTRPAKDGLDDRFHETGGDGTDDLLADSSFAIG